MACVKIEGFIRIIRNPPKERLMTKPMSPLIVQISGFRVKSKLIGAINGEKNFSARGRKIHPPPFTAEKA